MRDWASRFPSRDRARGAGGAAARLGAPRALRGDRPRPSAAVTLVLLTGLAAVGLAGFMTFSALFGGGSPAAASQGPGTAPTPDPAGDASVLTANPLYATGEMTEVTCPAPEVDVEDEASMEAFLHEITDCLDKAWSEQFAEGGMEFERPNRIFWYASGQSPCGNFPTEGTAAFYCQANKGLYLGVEDIVANSNETEHPEAYTFLLSHEYGHHVQGEAGILGYFHTERGSLSDPGERSLLTRRSELQANCLGGTFLGSVEDSLPVGSEEEANILEDAERRGDFDPEKRTHGSPENGAMWTAHGMDRGDPAACNTWSAGENVVG
ncbi:neutral zinc metallopeptidase [Nocardiopsis sp. CNT-189]|uniref:neutral zinc metallopeptidase n=1 Tax=Nocardiopsis oceanisediminis TaxID=2816862 RepID=UPI003B3AE844